MALTSFGLVKTTLIEYPGEVAAGLFTPGCNLRCPYCHNPGLIAPPYPEDLVSLDMIKAFLAKRASVLGGVSISGGEPLLHDDLYDIVDYIRGLGLKVKLDTNGTLPEKLIPERFDYLAMDIKTSLGKYGLVMDKQSVRTRHAIENSVVETIRKIQASGIPHEFRTTVVPGIVGPEDIKTISELLTENDRYILANFRNTSTYSEAYSEMDPYPASKLEEMQDIVLAAGIPCELRLQI